MPVTGDPQVASPAATVSIGNRGAAHTIREAGSLELHTHDREFGRTIGPGELRERFDLPNLVLDLEVLYAQHARYIAGVVHRILGGRDGEVDDIVQETFIDAFEGIGRIEDLLAARAWLVTVAVRRTRRFLAHRRRRTLFAFWAKDFAPRASDPRDRQPVDDLYDALERIPEDVRIPWVLHRVEQLSLPETAAVCEVSLATVKRRIADAENRLDRRLNVLQSKKEER